MEIANQDKLIQQLQCEINNKKQLIDSQFKNVSEISHSNKYLENVADDYKRYYQYIKSQKESQQQFLNMILDYLDRLILEQNMSKEALDHAKMEQKRTLNEIENINADIDELMSLPNIY